MPRGIYESGAEDGTKSGNVFVFDPNPNDIKKGREMPEHLQELMKTIPDQQHLFDEDDEDKPQMMEEDRFDKTIRNMMAEQEKATNDLYDGVEDGEGDYEYEVEEDEEEEELNPYTSNAKVDKQLKKEIEKAQQYKKADGVEFVEYDVFGLAKTAENARIKADLNLDDNVGADAPEGTVFIPPQETFVRTGLNLDQDVKYEDMDEEMKELFDGMEDDDIMQEMKFDEEEEKAQEQMKEETKTESKEDGKDVWVEQFDNFIL